MRNLLACGVLFGAVVGALGQTPVKIYTTPKLPMRDALERMNLTRAWNARVTVDGQRDGVFSVQVLPGAKTELLVQTYKGMVYLYDADNGDLIWKTNTVGTPYWRPQAAAFNSHSIFVSRRHLIHVLNRFDGSQRVYTYDARNKQFNFGYPLAFTPNAPLVADEELLYVPMGDRVHTHRMPDFDSFDKALQRDRERRKEQAAKEGKKEEGPDAMALDNVSAPEPQFFWGYGIGAHLTTSAPLLYGGQVSILTTDGTLTSIDRRDGREFEGLPFKAVGTTNAAAGQHLHMAYVASDDFNLYAVDMRSGNLKWRYIGGSPILQKPAVIDQGVFVAPERGGLRRIDRDTGRDLWAKPNRDASRFLAANDKFVYALDRNGKFFVLDGKRGTTLSTLDLSDWKIAVPNEWTDRVYLAAHDGQILCLRHRELTKPQIMKMLNAPEPKVEKKPEEKKKDEEDKEKAAGAPLGTFPTCLTRSWHAGNVPHEFDDRRAWALR